jgi:hypothetical protein
MKSALTVQIDRGTLEIKAETDMTTVTSTMIVLRKEGEAIHAHHPLLVDQDNLEARLHILNAPKHPYLLKRTPYLLKKTPYLLKKTPSIMIASLHLSGKNSTPAPEPFTTKKSMSTFSMTVIPRQMQLTRPLRRLKKKSLTTFPETVIQR